jgi:MFS family permease
VRRSSGEGGYELRVRIRWQHSGGRASSIDAGHVDVHCHPDLQLHQPRLACPPLPALPLPPQVTFINSIYFVGLAVGGILFGSLCDRIGRKAALYSSTALAAVSTLLGTLAPTFWVHFVSG